MKVTSSELYSLIREPYASRGEDEFDAKMVQLNTIKTKRVEATVVGSQVYKVILSKDTHTLDGECDCPAFSRYGPCKHMMSVGLALIEHNSKYGYEASSYCDDVIQKYEHLERDLKKKKKSELIELILNLSNRFDIREFVNNLD